MTSADTWGNEGEGGGEPSFRRFIWQNVTLRILPGGLDSVTPPPFKNITTTLTHASGGLNGDNDNSLISRGDIFFDEVNDRDRRLLLKFIDLVSIGLARSDCLALTLLTSDTLG